MAKSTKTTILFVLLVLVLNQSYLSLSDSDSVYESFLQCFTNKTSELDRLVSVDQTKVSDLVFTQSNTSYNSVLQSYIRNLRFNQSNSLKPVLIITPTRVVHVQASVLCSKKVGYQLKIRSGGHDYDGLSYVSQSPFFVLDMFNLRSIDVDVGNETAWVQSGATVGEVCYRIWEKSKVHGFPAGVCPTVGVGGHFSGGGYGNMMRKFGLSIDNIVDAVVVDVNGNVLDRKSMGKDLFWAIRGGGGASFGVVIAYKINLVKVPEVVTVFRVEQRVDENKTAVDNVVKWQLVAPRIDENLFIRLLLSPASSRVNRTGKTMRFSYIALYLGNADSLVSLLNKEFPGLGVKKENCLEMSWIQSVLWWGLDNETNPEKLLQRVPDSVKFLKRKSDYVQTPISKKGFEAIFKKMLELGNTGLNFNPYGGRMAQIPASDTPFPHRAGNLFKIQHSISWSEPGSKADNEYMTQIRSLYQYMEPYVSKNPRSAYFNYRDIDIGVMEPGKNSLEQGRVYGRKYFGANFDRLVKIKTAIDPDNFFRNEQSIPTSSG